MHYPLIAISFSENTMAFFEIIMSVVSFDLFPEEA